MIFTRPTRKMEVSGYNLSWHTFNSHLAELSRELYQEKYFSDITLVSDDLTTVPAHRYDVYPACSLVELLQCCALIGPELQSVEIFESTERS